MTHARQTIRDAITTVCSGLTTTGTKVYSSRVFPMADANLPGLIVYTSNEEIDEEEGKLAKYQHRNFSLVVEGYAKVTSGLDDKLDDIASEVETAIFGATISNIFALDLVSTEIELSDGLETEVGKIILTFQVQYLTSEGSPNTAL